MRFDGVALIGLSASTEVARRRDAAEVRHRADGTVMRLRGGTLARATLPIGLPSTLPGDPGSSCPEVAVLGLTEVTQLGLTEVTKPGLTEVASRPGAVAGPAWDPASGRPPVRGGGDDGGDYCTAAARLGGSGTTVAVLPPVRIHDLIAVEPLPGGRVHAARWGADTVACGRLPVHGPTHPPTAIDCPRCLERGVLGERIAAQVDAFPDLVAFAGPLSAAAAARWWWRTDHLDPGRFPAVLDSAVGAVVHALPGAPDPDALLDRLVNHSDHLSAAARTWAVAAARQRATTADGDAVRLLARLLPPAEAGDLLLDVLDEHRGDRSLEALLWEVAVRAGPGGSARLQRWRRIQAVAAALAP